MNFRKKTLGGKRTVSSKFVSPMGSNESSTSSWVEVLYFLNLSFIFNFNRIPTSAATPAATYHPTWPIWIPRWWSKFSEKACTISNTSVSYFIHAFETARDIICCPFSMGRYCGSGIRQVHIPGSHYNAAASARFVHGCAVSA